MENRIRATMVSHRSSSSSSSASTPSLRQRRRWTPSTAFTAVLVVATYYVAVGLTVDVGRTTRIHVEAQSSSSDYYGGDGGIYGNDDSGEYYGGGSGGADDGSGVGGGGGDYQDYNSYGDDNLYADYAQSKQMSSSNSGGAGGGAGGGGIGFAKLFAGCAASWIVGGKFHSMRLSKKLKAKFQKEQKQLYTQYYNDVYKLSEQNSELSSYTEKLKDTLKQTEAEHELEAMQREYDEFKQPDIDGDDRISRAEFNMYVKNYLANYPGLTEADYPRFEDFDHDNDGYVSFTEYAQQMALAAQKAEMEELYGSSTSGGGSDKGSKKAKDKSKAYSDLYENSVGSARTKMYS